MLFLVAVIVLGYQQTKSYGIDEDNNYRLVTVDVREKEKYKNMVEPYFENLYTLKYELNDVRESNSIMKKNALEKHYNLAVSFF